MNRLNRKRNLLRRGNALVEFTLVGIPLIFVLISIFEIARGMWIYHSLAYAAKSATRYAIVHGKNCEEPPNNCTVRVRDVALTLLRAGTGLVPEEANVTMRLGGVSSGVFSWYAYSVVNCNPLSSCAANNTRWPDDLIDGSVTPPNYFGGNNVGSVVEVTVRYPFRTALSLLWPGAGRVQFGTIELSASSTDTIQF